eukprot:TRINITY_DN7333_c0_g1_i1.p1 TRINITY_DN7333_c0_g1~~TRINITY_DN7333_c0_g1_i1.p1  ORF type:complete len:231 (-),score=43.00 TRINITY_DN7333_c0_g1_i1:1213-1905(-)
MDKYVRVEKPKEDHSNIQENEVRVMSKGRIRNYVKYAITLLEEKKHKSVQLKGMGRAIIKTISTSEVIKRRVADLHQTTELTSIDITDKYEPLEEGLPVKETKRQVSVITITLSSLSLDETNPGYQTPLPADMVEPLKPGEEPMRGMRNLEGGNKPKGRARAQRRRAGKKDAEDVKEGETTKKPARKRNNRRRKASVKGEDTKAEDGAPVKVNVVEASDAKPASEVVASA